MRFADHSSSGSSRLQPTRVRRTDSSINVAPLLEKLHLHTIRQGELATIFVGVSTIAPVQAEPLFIQLEYSTVGKNKGVESELRYSVGWLSQEDADIAKDNKNIYIVHVESLNDEVTIPTVNLGVLYIATWRNLVKSRIQS